MPEENDDAHFCPSIVESQSRGALHHHGIMYIAKYMSKPMAMATSGIAALLMPKGKTAHSSMKIPVKGLDKDSTCGV